MNTEAENLKSQISNLKFRAFTLIELLVVVTIIVILLALLIPSMDKAMALAERAVCMSNQRQIGNAIGYYQGDYKRFFPYGIGVSPRQLQSYPLDPNAAGPGWAPGLPPQSLLLRYLGNSAKVFRCPTDGKPANYNWWAYLPDPVARAAGSSYMFSETAISGDYFGKKQAMKSGNIVNPSSLGYMADGSACPGGWSWRSADPNDTSRTSTEGIRINWTHFNTLNFLYGDLHVQSVEQWTPRDGGLKDRVRDEPYSETLPQTTAAPG